VPGTEVRAVLSVKNLRTAVTAEGRDFHLNDLEEPGVRILRWDTQARYNNQLNLYKYKRLKLFLALGEKIDNLHEMTIDDLNATFSKSSVYPMLACFGDDLHQMSYEACPHCEGQLNALKSSMSQPFCGYLPSERPIYHECESCGLVVQSPSIHEDDVHHIYDRWDKQDFVASTNNPYTSDSVRCDLSKILPHLPQHARTLDLGGGVGFFSKFLSSAHAAWHVTHSDFEIKSNIEGPISSRVLDFTKEPIGFEQYDLITAWEVIEHVPYHRLSFVLQNIWRALTPRGFFIFSTPDFDSPLCKSFDFYASCPPFHYLVFGEQWLRRYFSSSREFAIFDVKHCSDFLDDAVNWYAYGKNTCPSMAMRNTAAVLQSIFEFDGDRKVRNHLLAAGLGTELVMALRKKDS
jgi:SAM-dependent methyltransferase